MSVRGSTTTRARRKFRHRDSALGDDIHAFAHTQRAATTKEGYLKKKTHLFRQYNPRYFKIVNHYLNYWNTHEDADDGDLTPPIGSLDLMGILYDGKRTTGIELSDCKMTIRFSSKGKREVEEMALRAESAPDIADWARSLKARIKYCRAMIESSSVPDFSDSIDSDSSDAEEATSPPVRPPRAPLAAAAALPPPAAARTPSPSLDGPAAAAAGAPAAAPGDGAHSEEEEAAVEGGVDGGAASELIAEVNAHVDAVRSVVESAAESAKYSVVDAIGDVTAKAQAVFAACAPPPMASPLSGGAAAHIVPIQRSNVDAEERRPMLEQGSMRMRKQATTASEEGGERSSMESGGGGSSSAAAGVPSSGGAAARCSFSANVMTLLAIILVLITVRLVLRMMPTLGADAHVAGVGEL